MATAYWKSETTDRKAGFWRAGHTPTLIAAFLYFDLAFMVWVLLGPLAPEIARTLALTPAEKGFMVATPTLAGAVLRVVHREHHFGAGNDCLRIGEPVVERGLVPDDVRAL